MAVTLQYLTDPFLGFQTKSGSLNTNGIIRVYDASTDDPAVTYCDFAGTMNPEVIRLDNNGRAVIIADDSRAYRVEVRDRDDALLYPVSPVFARGGGGGSFVPVNIVSGDGTVNVQTSTVAGVKTFDLSVDALAVDYAVCDSCTVRGTGTGAGYIVPANKVEGNLDVDENGILLEANKVYHVDALVNVAATAEGNPDDPDRRVYMEPVFMLGSSAVQGVKVPFDNSYYHDETVALSGDVKFDSDTYLRVYFAGYNWSNFAIGYISPSHVTLARICVHAVGTAPYSMGE